MSDKIVPTVEVVPVITDGVHVTLSVPTYDGDKLFTLSCDRDNDGDWRVDFSAPEDHEAENVRVGAAAGTYRLGAPEAESVVEVETFPILVVGYHEDTGAVIDGYVGHATDDAHAIRLSLDWVAHEADQKVGGWRCFRMLPEWGPGAEIKPLKLES